RQRHFVRERRPLLVRSSDSEDGADGDTSRETEPDQVLRSCKLLFSDEEFVDPQAPTSYVDVLNTMRLRHPSSREMKLMREEDEQCKTALQQCARSFVDGIIQLVSSEKEYYKFIIIACKENINKIMELLTPIFAFEACGVNYPYLPISLSFWVELVGFISCKNRDDIINGLERIEDDIPNGRFMWTENKDVRSNIVEALVERVGGPTRNLDATISQCVQKLTILRLWFHDSADTIVTQIEQLQVELVLLALRNWGFVVPLLFRNTDWIVLGELILSKVELVISHVQRNFKLSNDDSHLLQNDVINFGNMIIGDIAIDISTLEREISYWTTFIFLTSNDGVRESFSLLKKHVSDLSKLTTIQRYPLTFYDLQDTCQRFLAIYVIVQQILRVATDFAKHASFNNKKIQSYPSFGYIKIGSSDIHTVQVQFSLHIQGS
ncbi:hypothetical protein PVAP13_2NG479900, partial [Panicum virgatum]